MNTSSFNTLIVDEIRKYGLLQDRLPGDDVTLPITWDDIKIKPNDFVLSEYINGSLEKLYKNWLYLLSYSVIPTNDIPDMIRGDKIITDKGVGVEWGSFSQDIKEPSNELDGLKHIIKIQNTINTENYNIIAATNTNVILLSGFDTVDIDVIVNPDTARLDNNGDVIPESITRSDSSITHPSNGIFFQDIVDINVNQDKELFVLDSVHKTIFKFDLSGITALDEAILKNDTPGRLLTRMVGGDGKIDDKIRFINPICITIKNNDIYILDQDPVSKECYVKQFDSHLNWKNSYSLGNISEQSVIDMEYNSLFDQMYILCNDSLRFDLEPTIISLDINFNRVKTSNLMDFVKHDPNIATEYFKKLYFSIENPNIMYIVTEKNIYKKYVSRPTSFIGSFKFEDREIGTSLNNRNVEDIALFPVEVQDGDETSLKDEILLFEQDFNTVYRFIEDSGFENSLESEIDQNILLFDDLRVDSDENIDVISYNKAIFKTLYNNLILLENISRKFATFFDEKGISQYLGFRYVNESELETLNYEITMNHYIANNELVLSETINRCLRQIYDLQLVISENMQEKSINVYPDPNKTIKLD